MEGPTVSHSRNFWLSFFFFSPFFTVCAFLHVLFFLFPFTLGGFFFFLHCVWFLGFFFLLLSLGSFFCWVFPGLVLFLFYYWVRWVWVLKKKNCTKWQVWGPQIVWQILSDDAKRVWKIKWWVISDELWKLSDGNWVMKFLHPNSLLTIW